MRFARSEDDESSRVGRLPGRSDGEQLIKAAAEVLEEGVQSFSTNAVVAKSRGGDRLLRTSCSGTRTPYYWRCWSRRACSLHIALDRSRRRELGRKPAERLTSALIMYYRSRPRPAAALLIEEQRLRPATPRGVLTITDDAVFDILGDVPRVRYRDCTVGARYLSAMLCSMGVVAGEEPGHFNASAQARMQAALHGYISWYGGSQL